MKFLYLMVGLFYLVQRQIFDHHSRAHLQLSVWNAYWQLRQATKGTKSERTHSFVMGIFSDAQ